MPHLAATVSDHDGVAVFFQAGFFGHAANFMSLLMVFLDVVNQFNNVRLLVVCRFQLR